MNPCLSCGACCASFRVSFYWAESEIMLGGTVPPELTEKITPVHVAMKGTNQPDCRCIALEGTIGDAIGCSIYEQRSTTCREFEMGSEACLRARSRHRLGDLRIDVVAA